MYDRTYLKYVKYRTYGNKACKKPTHVKYVLKHIQIINRLPMKGIYTIEYSTHIIIRPR